MLGFVPEREKVFLGNGISQDECLVLILALVVDDKAFLEHPKKFFLIPRILTDSNHFQSTIPFPQISHNFEISKYVKFIRTHLNLLNLGKKLVVEMC